MNSIVTPDSGSTILLFNIVDKCEQRGQQNPVKRSAFLRMYSKHEQEYNKYICFTSCNFILVFLLKSTKPERESLDWYVNYAVTNGKDLFI